MHICIYVYVYVCIYVYIHTHIYIHICTCMYTHMYTHIACRALWIAVNESCLRLNHFSSERGNTVGSKVMI